MKRRLLFALGILTLAGVWFGPLPALARHSFSAHMTMHMAVVAVAAPCLALAIAGTAFDPVWKRPTLFPPVPMSVVELVVVWAWHAPALHQAARDGIGGLVLEQGAFLCCGLLVWLSAFGGDPERRRDRAGGGVVAMLLTSMHMTLLGALLALTPRPLYTHADHLEILAPLDDQHLGGAIMLLVGGVSYLAGGLWLTAGLVRAAAEKREAVA
jgi:putative membrane protein